MTGDDLKKLRELVKDELRPVKDLVEMTKKKVDGQDIFLHTTAENVRRIKEQQSLMNEKVDDLRKGLEIIDESVSANTASLIEIERTLESYAESYQINQLNIERLDSRLSVAENKLDIESPEDLKVAHVMHRNSGTEENNERVDAFFVAEKWGGKIENRESNKCDDLSWFDLNNLPDNIISYIKEDSQGKNISLSYEIPLPINYGFKYLSKWSKVPINNESQSIYIIEYSDLQEHSLSKYETGEKAVKLQIFEPFHVVSIK